VKKTLLAIVPAASLVSCTPAEPEEPAAPAAAPDATANPYGVPGANQPNYDPNAAAYQPIAPINQPANVPGPAPTLPTTPTTPATPTAPVAAASTHAVVPGDSLWGLARKYKVSVEAIQQANGLTGTQINVGQTINIPAAQ